MFSFPHFCDQCCLTCLSLSSPCALTSSTVGHGVLIVTSLGLERRPVLSTAQSRNLYPHAHKHITAHKRKESSIPLCFYCKPSNMSFLHDDSTSPTSYQHQQTSDSWCIPCSCLFNSRAPRAEDGGLCYQYGTLCCARLTICTSL